jgi:hypothetical protein
MELKDFRLISKNENGKKCTQQSDIATTLTLFFDLSFFFFFSTDKKREKYFYVEILRLVPSPHIRFYFSPFFARLKFEEIDKRTYHSKIIINSMKNNRGKT